MSFRPFTSESYAQGDRTEAWRDVLAAVGLQPASSGVFHDGHATASHRNAVGVALTRISAGSQGVAPLAPSVDGLPDRAIANRGWRGARVRARATESSRSAICFCCRERATGTSCSSVTCARLYYPSRRRRCMAASPANQGFGEARVVAAGRSRRRGLAVCSTRPREPWKHLSDAEWGAVAQSLVDLLMTFCASARGARIGCGPYGDAGCDPAPDLPDHRTSARRSRTVAGARGADGGNFRALSAKTVRRCQATTLPITCASAGCSGPGPNCPIRPKRIDRSRKSPIATAFRDSAHFSRTFRHRFGLPPREFRQQEAERASAAVELDRATRLAAGRAGPVARAPVRPAAREADRCCRQSGNRGPQEGG